MGGWPFRGRIALLEGIRKRSFWHRNHFLSGLAETLERLRPFDHFCGMRYFFLVRLHCFGVQLKRSSGSPPSKETTATNAMQSVSGESWCDVQHRIKAACLLFHCHDAIIDDVISSPIRDLTTKFCTWGRGKTWETASRRLHISRR